MQARQDTTWWEGPDAWTRGPRLKTNPRFTTVTFEISTDTHVLARLRGLQQTQTQTQTQTPALSSLAPTPQPAAAGNAGNASFLKTTQYVNGFNIVMSVVNSSSGSPQEGKLDIAFSLHPFPMSWNSSRKVHVALKNIVFSVAQAPVVGRRVDHVPVQAGNVMCTCGVTTVVSTDLDSQVLKRLDPAFPLRTFALAPGAPWPSPEAVTLRAQVAGVV